MNRRTLLCGLGLLLAAPVAVEAQQAGKVYRVGLLFVGDRQATPYSVLLRERLRDPRYRDGHEIMFEERFVYPDPETGGNGRR